MEVPNFFSDKEKIFNFDYSSIRDLIQSEIDHSTIIENLSIPMKQEIVAEKYFKSILLFLTLLFPKKFLFKSY